jgi:hypothetical protein
MYQFLELLMPDCRSKFGNAFAGSNIQSQNMSIVDSQTQLNDAS